MPVKKHNKEPSKLTYKQELLVQECINGKTQFEAYKIAYNASRMKEQTIRTKAAEEMNKPYVKQRYDELRSKIRDNAEKKSIFTVEGILTDLKELIDRNKTTDDRIAIDGIKTAMKHLGLLADKVEVSGEVKLITVKPPVFEE